MQGKKELREQLTGDRHATKPACALRVEMKAIRKQLLIIYTFSNDADASSSQSINSIIYLVIQTCTLWSNSCVFNVISLSQIHR